MIPDAISASQLAGLIGQAHLSDRIPTLRCGPTLEQDGLGIAGHCGGPFDLAFAFDQLMRKSPSLNAVQITCALGYVLNELIRYFDFQIKAIESREGAFDHLPGYLADEATNVVAADNASDRDALKADSRLLDGGA